MPYFRPEDFPEAFCPGSYSDAWEWEGNLDEAPKIAECPLCQARLQPEIETQNEAYAYIPSHYPGESTMP